MPPASPPDAGEEIPRTVEAMLKRYRQMLHALAFTLWRTSRHQAELEDFRSVADVAAWKAFERYDPARGASLETWIYGKVQFALRDYRRVLVGSRSTRSDARVRASSIPLEDMQGMLAAPRSDDPGQIVEALLLRDKLRQLLTPREADVVCSIYLDGCTQAELARRGGCRSSSVSFLCERALGRLRRSFGRARPLRASPRSRLPEPTWPRLPTALP